MGRFGTDGVLANLLGLEWFGIACYASVDIRSTWTVELRSEFTLLRPVDLACLVAIECAWLLMFVICIIII